MVDPIRQALESLLNAEVHIHVAGPEYQQARDAARTALAAERPESAEPVATLHVSDFRGYENYDFQHLVDLPPGHYKLFTACTAQPPAPAPAADGEHEELAQWLERIGDDYDDLYRPPSALIRPKLARAAALLREARPQPVPVAAPTPDDFRRWWRETGSDDSGPTPEMLLTANAWASSWAARCAQPIPQPPQANTTHPTPTEPNGTN